MPFILDLCTYGRYLHHGHHRQQYKAAQAYGAAKVAQIRGMDRGCLLSPDSSIRGNSTMPH